MDMCFSPFHNNILGTGATDATVKIWKIPEDAYKGQKETKDFVANLSGHFKKIMHLKWHPSSAFTMATSSEDGEVKIWDV